METTNESEQLFPNVIQQPTNIQKVFSKLNHPLTITWEQTAVLSLSLIGILTRFVGLGNRVMSHDESLHVYYSWLLSTGKGFVHTPMMHGPFLFESTALVNFLFGANDFVSRLIPAILGILIAILVPQLLKPWIGKIGAPIGSVLFLISPYMLYYSRYIRHDTLVIAWMLLAVFASLAYLHERKERYLILFVVALALMFSTMEITFIYLAINVLLFTTFLTNPEMRAALWDILWNRDYTRYANLAGASLKPPTEWPLAEKMRVYVRKDIALQMLSLSLGSTMLADIPQPVDAYAGNNRLVHYQAVLP